MNLTVIKNDKPRVDKQDLYIRAYEKILDGYRDNPDQDIRAVIKKLAFYGVKAVNGMKKPSVIDLELIEYRFQFADMVKAFLAVLTPIEFSNLFPIIKEYNGDRWETKDYFSTMEYVSGLSQDEPIGAGIFDLLWNYHNTEIRFFMVRLMGLMSDLRRTEGYPGIMEEWAEENGIGTYTMHTDGKGKKFMVGSHGSTMRVKTSIPKYLRLIRKEG